MQLWSFLSAGKTEFCLVFNSNNTSNIECRKKLRQPALEMLELPTIEKFDTIVEATLLLCGQNEHDELMHPSTANKTGFDLARMVALKYGICLRNKDIDGKEESDGFLKYMKIHWSSKVST